MACGYVIDQNLRRVPKGWTPTKLLSRSRLIAAIFHFTVSRLDYFPPEKSGLVRHTDLVTLKFDEALLRLSHATLKVFHRSIMQSHLNNRTMMRKPFHIRLALRRIMADERHATFSWTEALITETSSENIKNIKTFSSTLLSTDEVVLSILFDKLSSLKITLAGRLIKPQGETFTCTCISFLSSKCSQQWCARCD